LKDHERFLMKEKISVLWERPVRQIQRKRNSRETE